MGKGRKKTTMDDFLDDNKMKSSIRIDKIVLLNS